MVDEAKGSIYYGIHFYPGLAQYEEPGKDPYKVFLNEDTLRSMDPTFAGRPVFVHHVDEVQTDINELRKEADGWVIESFFNGSDGKHWVKFIVVSERGEQAIERGMKLSNCYLPKTFGPGGTWNGIYYNREITTGIYEHLAIVPNPRYEESVIMTPEEFKKYNEDKIIELKKLANNNNEGERKMGFSFFKRAKVENSLDLESMSVVLPKSKQEVTIVKLINDADEKEMKKEEPVVAQGHHLVDCNGKTMTVNEMVAKHKEMMDAMEAMKKDESEGKEEMQDEGEKKSEDPAEFNDDEEQDMDVAKKPVPKSDSDKMDEKQAMKLEEHEEKEIKDAKKKNAWEKAERLRNANKSQNFDEVTVSLSHDKVKRGKELFGS